MAIKKALVGVLFSLYNLLAPRAKPSRSLPGDPFEALNQSFDAIWVLTIPRNTERQAFIRKEFAGLKFEFITGVDGKTLTSEDPRIDVVECARRNGRPVRTNELACTFSHVLMHERMIREGLEKVLIFEDDAVFDRKKGRWLKYILERLPADWELLYLGYRDGELRGFTHEFLEFLGKKRATFPIVSRTVYRGLRTAAGHDFTHAYAITSAGVGHLLPDAYPIRQTADGYLEDAVLAGKIRAYATVPKLFLQHEDLGSSIHKV
jgi:glycosyl transferase family 25